MAAQGALQEQVYDVVRSSDRKPDAPGKLPSVGTTVGIEHEEAMAGLAQAPSPPALSRIRDGPRQSHQTRTPVSGPCSIFWEERTG